MFVGKFGIAAANVITILLLRTVERNTGFLNDHIY